MYTRQKKLQKKTKKRNVYAVRVTFHPYAALTPLNPSYPVVHVGSYGRRNHSCTISAQPVQGLGSYGNPKFRHLDNRFLAITHKPIVRFQRNFVRGSRMACRQGLHDKNCKFTKSKTADGRHFEHRKIAITQ